MAGILIGLFVPGPVPVAQAAVGPGPKIYVFPYQPVFKGISKNIGGQTTDLLKNEIKHSDEVRLQKGPIFIPEAETTKVRPLSDKDLKRAMRYHQEGKKHYQALRFGRAIKSFAFALAKFETSLAQMTDITPVLDTLLMLSVCYYRQDQEKDGAKMLAKVIRLKPDLILDPEKYPPMFRNTAEAISKKLLLKRRGEVEVVANEEDALVFFDGRKVGSTPVLLKELVPGDHFVRVEKEGLQSWAGKVTVVSTQRKRVLAALGGVKKATGPLGEIAMAIRSNRLSPDVLKKAADQGKRVGADYVVLGGVAKLGGNYRVGSFLLNVKSRELCPLPEIRLDPDLLGASVEVYNMASVMYKRVEGCPDPIKDQVVAVVQTAKQKTGIRSVAVGPSKVIASSPGRTPATPPSLVAPRVAVPAKGPAVPGRAPALPPRKMPAEPPRVTTTKEGLVTTGSSAISPAAPIVMPTVPVAETIKPIDEQKNEGPAFYKTWWFWTIASVVVVGGTAGVLHGAGVFDGGVDNINITTRWPAP
jgi:archaellum component FlaG (FlaF/FlaG flagellin family)